VPKLNNWSVVVTQKESNDPYLAPELNKRLISLSGHDGSFTLNQLKEEYNVC
jgi:hypothetical protein